MTKRQNIEEIEGIHLFIALNQLMNASADIVYAQCHFGPFRDKVGRIFDETKPITKLLESRMKSDSFDALLDNSGYISLIGAKLCEFKPEDWKYVLECISDFKEEIYPEEEEKEEIPCIPFVDPNSHLVAGRDYPFTL